MSRRTQLAHLTLDELLASSSVSNARQNDDVVEELAQRIEHWTGRRVVNGDEHKVRASNERKLA